MKGWKVYQNIQQLKESGFNKSQVARRLNCNRRTVDKYWGVSPDDYAEMKKNSQVRTKKLEKYKGLILSWLQENPDISAAQVEDWLKEKNVLYSGKERTLRRYVARLREEYGIKKITQQRQFEAVDELPAGQQGQVDFGQIVLKNTQGKSVRLWGLALVLAHSRYKYVEWMDRAPTGAEFVQMLYNALQFIGGMPREIVFDQDRLLAVSENYGDIVYTEEFERFRQSMGFRVHLCRKNDPQSKGKVEAVVKYAKYNYARHRVFDNITNFNEGCIEWLKRTGNAKIHGTTKKVPAEVFEVEHAYLQPIPIRINKTEVSLTRDVRKDNTILYLSNRYSVPIGTYSPGRQVVVVESKGHIQIIDPETGEILAVHECSIGKGKLIKNNNHRRDHSKRVNELQAQALRVLGESPDAEEFLNGIRREKIRYARDQFQLILTTCVRYPPDILAQALGYCLERGLFSAVEFRAATEYYAHMDLGPATVLADTSSLPLVCMIKPETRDLGMYAAIYGGGSS